MSIFSKVRLTAPKSSNFNLSHERKFTLDMGNLVPILCEEVLPGDKWSVSTSQMLRMMPMLALVMHEIQIYTHFFFVPNRLIWENWEPFITGGERGDEEPVFPTFTEAPYKDMYTGFPILSLGDYFGLPTDVPFDKEPISQLPFRAYAFIWNEYYRDQNLQDPVDFQLGDGNIAVNFQEDAQQAQFIHPLLGLRKRAWQHDYFTSALPFAQKGAPVQLPLGDIQFNEQGTTYLKDEDGNNVQTVGFLSSGELPVDAQLHLMTNSPASDKHPINIDNSENLSVGATTIEDLRRAFKLQEWLEKNARAGSRYIESVLAHFGVHSSDARLQRPEYLGGGMSPMLISEVLQTSETTSTPLGEMAGHGINMNKNHSFSRSFEEHGQVIGIMSIRPKTAYSQGIPRKYQKFDKFDYFWPEFQHIGEQAILNKEVWYSDTNAYKDSTFGYIPRYAEYRFIQNSIHGDFRDTLEFWHLSRKFSNMPVLNGDFITSDPSNRIFAVEESEEAHIICQLWHNIKARRKMSYFGDPSFR